MKFVIVFILIILAVITGAVFINSGKQKPPSAQITETVPSQVNGTEGNVQVDYTAKFAIFTNGTFRVFTAPMYHNLSADVFIQAENPHVIQVKKTGITWREFFATLPFSLDENCLTTGTKETYCADARNSLKFFLNDLEMGDALSQTITENDQLLVTFGPTNDSQIPRQLLKLKQL